MRRSEHLDFEIVKKRARELRSHYLEFKNEQVLEYMRIRIRGAPPLYEVERGKGVS